MAWKEPFGVLDVWGILQGGTAVFAVVSDWEGMGT